MCLLSTRQGWWECIRSNLTILCVLFAALVDYHIQNIVVVADILCRRWNECINGVREDLYVSPSVLFYARDQTPSRFLVLQTAALNECS